MSASQSGVFNLQQFTDLGAPLVSGRLYTFLYGTTTHKVAYTNHEGTIPHTYTSDGLGGLYIALNARGELPAPLYLSGGSYDLALKRADGSTVWTRRADPVYDITNDLSGPGGASLITYTPSGTGADARTVKAKLDDFRTVEDWGAVGDGVTDDSAAFLDMAVATNGTIRMLDKEYYVGQLNLPAYNRLVMAGAGMPSPSLGIDKLINGTVLLGGVSARANNSYLANFGVDNGSARALIGIADGLVLNAKTGEAGPGAMLFNMASLGPTAAGTTHALLVQGYEHVTANNIYCAKHQFGLVTKCRNVSISDVIGDDCRTALVYPKSDVPAFAGNVLLGTAGEINITNVGHRAASSNAEASAVYLHASTAAFSSARVANVSTVYGFTALRIQGGGLIGDPAISGITAVNIRGERSQYALYCGGFTYDWSVSNVQAINPSTGSAFYMDSGAFGWSLNGVNCTITDAAITGDNVGTCYGEGSWDAVAVRNPFRTMKVTTSWANLATVKTGRISGQCINSEDRNLVGINGAVAFTGNLTPKQTIMPGSVVKLSGGFNLAASALKMFCNLVTGAGRTQRFACSGVDTGSNVVTQAVQLNDFQLSVEPSLLGGFKEIYIDGITFIR